MELLAVAAMLACATAAGIGVTWSRRRSMPSEAAQHSRRDAEEMEASIAYAVLRDREEDPEIERQVSAIARGRVVRGIDLVSWAEALQRAYGREEASRFLERLVAGFAARRKPVSIDQYSRLLDVVFALGFHTDVLARLRRRYAFDDGDPAREWRAGRLSGSEPLYDPRAEADARRLLGIGSGPTRREIVLAYRRAAAATHPDRFHESDPRDRATAEERFIAVVRAAELLLGTMRD